MSEAKPGNGITGSPLATTPLTDTTLEKHLKNFNYFGSPASDNRLKFQFPIGESQYVWQNMSLLYPTTRVPRSGGISGLEVDLDDTIGEVKFTGKDNVVRTVNEHFDAMPLDAILVMKGGKILHERYKTMTPDSSHITFSSSKVFSSTILAMLEEEGKVDLSKPVTHYLPEFKDTVWDTVLVRHVADMQNGLNATEHDDGPDSRTNPHHPFYRWTSTLGVLPNKTGDSNPFDVMRTLERRKPGGEVFEYNSMNPFLLARLVEKVEDRPFEEIFRKRIWSKIGAEHDLEFVVTPQGYSLPYGFTSTTLRDFARFGAIFTPSAAKIFGEEIISSNVVARIQKAGNPKAYTGGYVGDMMTKKFKDDAGTISNAYMWDAIFPDGDMFKGGVGGQGIYVSPSRDLVLVWFTTGNGEEWNEAMGRAIAKNFD